MFIVEYPNGETFEFATEKELQEELKWARAWLPAHEQPKVETVEQGESYH